MTHWIRWLASSGAALAITGLASSALADLEPAFVGKVTVDSGYVTGASGATDIAFSADGRALVTQKNGTIRIRRADGTFVNVPYPFGGNDFSSTLLLAFLLGASGVWALCWARRSRRVQPGLQL